MKLTLVLAFLAVVAARPDDDFTRYKNINIDEIVHNKDLLKTYVECFLGTGPCNAESSEIKSKIPHTLENACSPCSKKQKILVSDMILAIKTEFPEYWEKLEKIYNPEGKYEATIDDLLKTYGH